MEGAAERVQRAVRASMRNLPGMAVLVFDPDGLVLDCYGGALARHGYQPEMLVGRRLSEVIPAPVWESTAPLVAAALAGRAVKVDRVSYDRTAEYEVTASPLADGGEIVGGTLLTREVTDLRATQRELAETARQFQALAETSLEGHARYGADGTLRWTSPSMDRVLGRPMAALVGTKTQLAVHPDDVAGRDAVIAELLTTGEPRTHEFRAEHGDGTWHWFESTVRGWFDEHRRLLEIHVTTRDVTARRVSDQLRRQWQITFDSTRRGIMLTDPATNIIQQVNSAFAAMHGGTPADFAGMPLVSVFSEAAAEQVPDLAQFVNDEGYLHYVTEHVRLDGTVFPCDTEVVAARDSGGDLLYRVAWVEDLTEQQARHRTEQRAIAQFETAFDLAPIGMCLVDPDGRFLRVNAALCRVFARTERELLTANFQALTHPDDRRLDLELLEATLRGERDGYEHDKRYLTPVGEIVEAELSVQLIRDPDGAPVHFVVQVVELTERIRLERQLQATLRVTRDLLAGAHTDPLRAIAVEAGALAGADRVLVLLPVADPSKLRVAVAVGDDVAVLAGREIDREGSVSGEVLRTGRAQIVTDLRSPGGRRLGGPDPGPTIAVPLLGDSAPRGVLALGRNRGRASFNSDDLALATSFAGQAAIALELLDSRALAQQVELLEDRDRIARDLHDHVIQRLFATGLSLQALSASATGAQAERLNRGINDIDATIAQIRSTIYGLRIPLGGAADVRDRVLQVLEDVRPMLTAEPAVTFAGPLEVVVAPEVLDEAVAVLRETLTNVARHAHAGRVLVAVAALTDSRELVLEVTDDGVGLGPTARRSGLSNLRKRAESRGGQFTLESPVRDTGRGTRVRWAVPVA